MTDYGADWLALPEKEREARRARWAEVPLDPSALALTASIVRRALRRAKSETAA